MSLPGSVQAVTVNCGPYLDAAGTPCTGKVSFRPSAPVVSTVTGTVIVEASVTATLNGSGSATVTVPATDGTGLTATGWMYSVTHQLSTASGDRVHVPPVTVQLPASAPSVDLDLTTAVTATDGTVVALPAVVSVAGLSGAIQVADLRTALGLGSAALLAVGTTAGTVAAGDDSRFTNARTPTAHASSHAAAGSDPVTVTQAQVTGLAGALAAKADLASPAMTGTPTAPTAAAGAGTTQVSTTAYSDRASAAAIGAALALGGI